MRGHPAQVKSPAVKSNSLIQVSTDREDGRVAPVHTPPDTTTAHQQEKKYKDTYPRHQNRPRDVPRTYKRGSITEQPPPSRDSTTRLGKHADSKRSSRENIQKMYGVSTDAASGIGFTLETMKSKLREAPTTSTQAITPGRVRNIAQHFEDKTRVRTTTATRVTGIKKRMGSGGGNVQIDGGRPPSASSLSSSKQLSRSLGNMNSEHASSRRGTASPTTRKPLSHDVAGYARPTQTLVKRGSENYLDQRYRRSHSSSRGSEESVTVSTLQSFNGSQSSENCLASPLPDTPLPVAIDNGNRTYFEQQELIRLGFHPEASQQSGKSAPQSGVYLAHPAAVNSRLDSSSPSLLYQRSLSHDAASEQAIRLMTQLERVSEELKLSQEEQENMRTIQAQDKYEKESMRKVITQLMNEVEYLRKEQKNHKEQAPFESLQRELNYLKAQVKEEQSRRVSSEEQVSALNEELRITRKNLKEHVIVLRGYHDLKIKLQERNGEVHDLRRELVEKERKVSALKSRLKEQVTQQEAAVEHTLKAGGYGLPNLGNSCYMNAVLQCLFSVAALRDYFLLGHYSNDLNYNSEQEGEVAMKFAQVFHTLDTGATPFQNLKNFKAALGSHDEMFLGDEDQQEAHDLLSCLLQWLHNDLMKEAQDASASLLHRADTTNSSFISDLFHGLLQMTIHCRDTDQTVTVTEETFQSLTLPMVGSDTQAVEELLTSHFRPRTLEWDCHHCRRQHTCLHTTKIIKLPSILVLHFSRYTERVERRKARVVYPTDGLTLEAHPPTAMLDPVVYRLLSVCNHHGTMNRGHYTAYSRDRDQGERWWFWDDKDGQEVSLDHVHREDDAHILFYEAMKDSEA